MILASTATKLEALLADPLIRSLIPVALSLLGGYLIGRWREMSGSGSRLAKIEGQLEILVQRRDRSEGLEADVVKLRRQQKHHGELLEQTVSQLKSFQESLHGSRIESA